jgi:hypothetical protein
MRRVMLSVVLSAIGLLSVANAAEAISGPPIPQPVIAAFDANAQTFAKARHLNLHCYTSGTSLHECFFQVRGAKPTQGVYVNGKASSRPVRFVTIQPVMMDGPEASSPSCLAHDDRTLACTSWQHTCYYQRSEGNAVRYVNTCKAGWKRLI